MPTERGYRYYADELLGRLEPHPAAFPLDLTSTSTEVESALQATTEMLSQVTRLLALVSAPPLEATHVRHVEVLLLQPQLVMVVVITSAGGVSKRLFHFDGAGRPGPRAVGGRLPERGRRRPAARHGLLRRRFEDRGSRRASASSSPRSGPRSRSSSRPSSASTSAAPPTCSARSARRSSTRTAACSSCVEQRAATCSTCSASRATSQRPYVRVGARARRIRRSREIALVGACYGLVHRALGAVSLVGPVRMDYEKALGAVRSAALELSRFVESIYDEAIRAGRPLHSTMATTDRDYYELLGVARRRDEAEIKRPSAQLARELHPDVSDAPDAEERFREVVEAYEVLSKTETRELYDRYGHAGLRSGGFQAGHVDFGNLADLFSAFFGDDVCSAAAARRAARAVPTSRATVEIELVEAAHGVTREVPFEVAVTVHALRRRRRRAGDRDHDLPDLRRIGRLQQVTRSVFGEFVRTADLPDVRRHRPPDRAAVHRVPRRRPGRRGADAHRRDPARNPRRPADPPHAARGTPGSSAAAPATCTSRCGSAPTSDSCARATTSTRPST